MLPKDKIRIQLCIILLPAGSIGSPDTPIPQQYPLLDAAQKI
jgi:hypothetical protein